MEQLKQLLEKAGLDGQIATYGAGILAFVALCIIAYTAHIIAKEIILRAIQHFAKRSKTIWDDILVGNKFFSRLCHVVPAVIFHTLAPVAFKGSTSTITAIETIALVYIAFTGLLAVDALLNSVVGIYRNFEFSRRIPIKGFIQVIKIVLYATIGISIVCLVLGKKPGTLLAGMGAMTAILLLIFKDSILGLVAGIQLSANHMVRIGDWIEMPKYNADGDVIDISLTTVKVQNWDKTIATIPTYALVTDSFKNWRGMSESGGRRIKRAVYIDMTSIKFCSEEMLARFKKFQYLTDYITQKQEEISQHNKQLQIDNSELVNGRRMTNVGNFRAYMAAYLKHHPKINQNMTFLIRHLNPTSSGLPIEIYVFCSDKIWANYEAIQADIFDHMLAVIPQFELRVFQNPTGADFKNHYSSITN